MSKLPISLCMICRDEEEFLEQCLMAVMPLVKQMVVVDTGSSDNTVEIAESMGAEVHKFEWIDDFAAARNFSLSFAKEKWVIVLDADEMLDSFSISHVEDLIENPGISSLEVTIHNLNDKGPAQSFNLVRMFRKHKDIKYKNPIHESVSEAIVAINRKKNMITAHSGLQIQHFGYLQEQLSQKGERNLNLIRKILQKEPENLYFQMKEYEELEKLGRREECNYKIKETFEYLASLTPDQFAEFPFAPMIAVNYTQLLLDDGQWEEVINTADRWLKIFLEEPWLLFMRSVALMNRGELEEAKEGFRTCLSLEIKPGDYYVEPGISSWLSRHALAEIAMVEGDPAEAKALLKQVREENPNHFPALALLFDLYVAESNAREAMALVMEVLSRDENNLWALMKGANLLYALKMEDKAAAWCEKALALAPDLEEAENLLIKIKGN